MSAKLSFIHPNGRQGSGGIATRLLKNNMDVGALRPFIDNKGRSAVVLNSGKAKDGSPVFKKVYVNADATLRKDEWELLDGTVQRVQRDQLRMWNDMVTGGMGVTVPNAMGTTVYQYQSMTDSMDAALSMSPLAKTKRGRSEFGLHGTPLPIVHSDFSFDIRSVDVSRRMGTSLDMIGVEQATYKCARLIEDLTVGRLATYSYAGYPIYGFTNHPQRLTKTLTLPTGGGWTPETTYNEVLDMLQQLDDINFDGPYGLYFSRGWTKYMSRDYSAAYPGSTLRSKLGEIDEISYVRKAHRLNNFQILIVQLNSMTFQALQGVPLQVVSWTEEGGMELVFKVMGIMIPQVRINSDNLTGICHGVAA